MIQSHSGIKSF